MDCMGTPTWVRHVQETEWSFHDWHSSCPVPLCLLSPLCTPATPELRARSPHVAGARSLGDGSPAAAALGVRAGIGARARLPPTRFHQTCTRAARGAGKAQPTPRRAAGLTPMADHDCPRVWQTTAGRQRTVVIRASLRRGLSWSVVRGLASMRACERHEA